MEGEEKERQANVNIKGGRLYTSTFRLCLDDTQTYAEILVARSCKRRTSKGFFIKTFVPYANYVEGGD